MLIPEITPSELANELAGANPPSLLDVREDEELAVSHLEGIVHIPLQDLPDRVSELSPEANWVVICRSGGRSGRATAYLQQIGFGQVRNLTGGMKGWAAEIDPALPVA